MATQSQLAQPGPVEDPSNAQQKPDGGGTAQGGPESDLAWEIVKEECHDTDKLSVLEQLPLTLQRNFSLMRDLDEQVAAHLQAIPAVLQDYLSLRMKLAQDVVMVDSSANGAVEQQHPPTEMQRRASRAASFSSASLTPITESPPSTRSLSPRQTQDDSPIDEGEEDEEDNTEDLDTSLETRESAPTGPTGIELIKRVATLATNAVRGSQEKVNLSNAAFAAIDRHVRALDIAIAEQENAIAVGLRSGTRPAAIAAPNGSTTSPAHARPHRHSQSFESNNLLALAEVASVFQAAEKTLENIQPPLSAISTNLSPVIEKEEMIVVKVTEKPAARARSKPKVETKVVNGKTKRTQQTTKKEKKSAKKDVVIEVDEPTYCFCNRISFGKMIACDNPNCKREWFHWECVGITRAPPATAKWYCRDCEAQEPVNKRRRKR